MRCDKTSCAIGPTMLDGRLAGTIERIAEDMSDRLKAEREAAAARRNLLTQDAIERTGITEEMIGELVTRFYGRVREDALLGPVFAIVRNWDEHLAKLRDFWSSVVLMSGRYHGSPMRAHLQLNLVGDHFDRWLDLFEQTAREVCPPAAAALFIDKARRIADSFEMASATVAGRIASPRHVLRP
ncbi:hemoglobin [Bradyrhizobium daqingense]